MNKLIASICFVTLMLLLAEVSRAELWIYSPESTNEAKLKKQVPSVNKRDFYSYISRRIPAMSYGTDELLVEVLDELRPNKEWLIRMDSGLKDYLVSWRSNAQWYEILEAIDKQNNVNIFLNHDEKVIGTSKELKALPYLSMREPMLWRISSRETLKENLERWAFILKYELVWNVDSDYPIEADAAFYGPLFGEKGALNKTFRSINSAFKNIEKLGYRVNENNQVISVYSIAHKIKSE